MQSTLWLIQLAPSIYWLADWETDMLMDWLTYALTVWLTDWLAEWLTYWLIDWLTCWLTVWPTDWLTDLLTCWETEWLTGRIRDGLSEIVMGRLVDCCWPVLLNLQANFLTMWVLFIITAWLNFHLMELRYVYRKSVNVLKPFFISSSAYEGVLINRLLNTVN